MEQMEQKRCGVNAKKKLQKTTIYMVSSRMNRMDKHSKGKDGEVVTIELRSVELSLKSLERSLRNGQGHHSSLSRSSEREKVSETNASSRTFDLLLVSANHVEFCHCHHFTSMQRGESTVCFMRFIIPPLNMFIRPGTEIEL